MTLTVLHLDRGWATLSGDLLRSSPTPAAVAIPTVIGAPQELPVGNGYYVSGLVQKVVLLRPWCAVGWADSLVQAAALLTYLDNYLPDALTDIRQFELVWRLYDRTQCSDLQAVIAIGTPKSVEITCVNSQFFPFHEDDTRICIMGSGTPEFYDFHGTRYVSNRPGSPFDGMIRAFKLMSEFIIEQAVRGAGIENAAGGGLEVAVLDTNGFYKMDKVLSRRWQYIPDVDSFDQIGFGYLHFYEGDTLVVAPVTGDGRSRRHFVRPPHKLGDANVIAPGRRYFDWIVDEIGVRGERRLRTSIRGPRFNKRLMEDWFEIDDEGMSVSTDSEADRDFLIGAHEIYAAGRWDSDEQ